MQITSSTLLGEIAVDNPSAIPLFEEFAIDYCCGGTTTLGEACERHHLNLAEIVSRLTSVPSQKSGFGWQIAPLTELIDHIILTHHSFARQRLVLLAELSAKVARRHGDTYPEVLEIQKASITLHADMTHHFHCEEDVLFPYIRQLETQEKAGQDPVFTNVEFPIARMMTEHSQTGNELDHLRQLTNSYRPPADACTTFRALYSALEEFERDLHQHIHLENNILFPRAIALAQN